MLLCQTCGSILSPVVIAHKRGGQYEQEVHCKLCQEKGKVEEVAMPYIFRYLVAQLASVNIKIKIDVVEQ
jgi:DNA-directed RNA polymerase I subunit RPA2